MSPRQATSPGGLTWGQTEGFVDMIEICTMYVYTNKHWRPKLFFAIYLFSSQEMTLYRLDHTRKAS